jgi:hypothetical protein
MTRKLMAIWFTYVVFLTFVTYMNVAYFIFQWRNPKANEISFYRNFVDVVSFRKLEQYQ